MRRRLQRTTLAAAILVGAAACGSGDERTQAADAGPDRSMLPTDLKHACDVLTLEMARQILGEAARRSEVSAPVASSSDHIEGSTCTYEAAGQTSGNGWTPIVTASIVLKAAKTSTGKRSNQTAFQETRTLFDEGTPIDAVAGMENTAYYIGGGVNQLHALVNDGEYGLIVSAMQPGGDYRAATEKLGRLIVEQL